MTGNERKIHKNVFKAPLLAGIVTTQSDINELKPNKKKWKTHVASGPEPVPFMSKAPGVVGVIETESRRMIARAGEGGTGV